MKGHDPQERIVEHPFLLDFRDYNRELSYERNTPHTRRSQRIKRDSCSSKQEEEDLKSESETLSPSLTATLRREESGKNTFMDVDEERHIYEPKNKQINNRSQRLCHIDDKRRSRRNHCNVNTADILKKHRSDLRSGYIKEEFDEIKVNPNTCAQIISRAMANKQQNLGSGYFGTQRRSLRLIDRME